MPRIPSPNPDSPQVEVPGLDPGYSHPADTRKGPISMAFQITSPFNRRVVLLPHALVLHVNPMNLQETSNQKVERFQTRGAFVEQHWPSDLTEISADQSTGAFMNIQTGLTSVLRQKTIAWDRYRDLHDLFKNNGSLRDPQGAIVLQGLVMLMYDRGIYLGTFRSFECNETDDSPFAFQVNWTFKVEETIVSSDMALHLRSYNAISPQFQSINTAPRAGTPVPPDQDLGTVNPVVGAGSHGGAQGSTVNGG
jgi:hypothetical protein